MSKRLSQAIMIAILILLAVTIWRKLGVGLPSGSETWGRFTGLFGGLDPILVIAILITIATATYGLMNSGSEAKYATKTIGILAIFTTIFYFGTELVLQDQAGAFRNNLKKAIQQLVLNTDNSTTKSSVEESTTGPIIFGRNETSIIGHFKTATRRIHIPVGKCVTVNPGKSVLETITVTDTYMDLKPKRPVTVTSTVYDKGSSKCIGGSSSQ